MISLIDVPQASLGDRGISLAAGYNIFNDKI